MTATQPTPEAAPPRKGRWLRWSLAVGFLILACSGVAYLAYRARGAAALQTALDRLDADDPGWRLADLDANRPEVPAEANSAPVVGVARKLLPANWPPKALDDALEKLPPPERKLTAAQYDLLCRELDAVEPAVQWARDLTDLPRGRHVLVRARNPFATRVEDQQGARAVTNLLRLEALRRTQEDQPREALRAARATFNAGRSIGDEPFLISQLVRIACVSVACNSAERVLAQTEPPPDELTALQELALEEDGFNDLHAALRGERACLHEALRLLGRGEMTAEELFESRASWWENGVMNVVYSDRARAEHPLLLDLMTRLVGVSRLPAHEQSAAEKVLDAEIRAVMGKTVLVQQILPATLKVSQAARRKHAMVRCLAVLLALERYRRDKGNWPDTLEALTPRWLPAVPTDPFDGKPLRYQRLPDGRAVYSVGVDGVDNGGVLDKEKGALPGSDVGFRLWDPDSRGQLPLPTPLP